jgi:hypothetical protein
MRLFLLVVIAVLAVDAYFYSGAYTQTAVHEVSSRVQSLASNVDTKSERPTPPRPVPDHS